MNYNSLLGLAKQTNNEKSKQPIKGFSTEITPAKKPPRSHVPSANVRAFLAKQEQDAKDKEIQARKDKEKLLALRAKNSKSNKAAKLMASRTKDNDFSKIRLTEDQVETRDKVEMQLKRRVILDKVERMKARIKLEEHEAQLPHKRKRKPKAHPDEPEAHSPSPPPSPPPSSRPNKLKKPQRPPPPPLSFQDLMKMAAVKQFENPDDVSDVEEERPLTKAERMEEEYKRYKQGGGMLGRTAFETDYLESHKNDGKRKRKGKTDSSKGDAVRSSESVPRSTDVRNNNVNRVSDSRNNQQVNRNSQQGNDSRNRQQGSDSRNHQLSNGVRKADLSQDNRYAKPNVDHRREQQNGSFRKGSTDNTNVQRDNRMVQRPPENRTAQRPPENRMAQRPPENRTAQRPPENRTAQRPPENRTAQRPPENRTAQRPPGNRMAQRPPENRAGQRAPENKDMPPRSADKNNGQRFSENRSVYESSEGNRQSSVNKSGDSRLDNRGQNAKAFTKVSERPSQGMKNNVPSYQTQPARTLNNRPNSEPQRFGKPHKPQISAGEKRPAPPPKHESAFRNSLPPKKPRLDTQPHQQEIIREKPVTNVNRFSAKNSSGVRQDARPRGETDVPRKTKPPLEDQSRQQIYKQMTAKPNKPVITSNNNNRTKTKVMLNENWLEEDAEPEGSERLEIPRRKLPMPSSSAPQKRPIEPDHGRAPVTNCRDDRKPMNSQRVDSNRRPEERRPLQQDRRSEQASNICQERPVEGSRKKQQHPQKKTSESRENDYGRDEDEERFEKAPRKSFPVKKPGPFQNPSGPTGSRRPLDAPIPVKSMARNPNKLPPIRTSKLPPIRSSKLPPIRSSKCSYIKSDSEDEEDDDEYEEDDEDMADFIDDGPQPLGDDVSKHIRAIFGYDKRRYLDEDDDDEAMESSYAQQMKEEARSMRIGRMEDIEEEKKELERKLAMLKRKR